jgi:hypothetical protein
VHGREQGGRLNPTRRAGLAVAATGVLWAGLCLSLFASGHAPSGPTGPLSREHWYLAQAALLPLLLPALWWLQVAVTRRVLPAGSDPAAALGWAYAGAVCFALVLPEAAAFLSGGMTALRSVAPIAGAAMVLAAWGGAAAALRRVRGIGWGEAVARSLPGLLAQAIVGAPFLR